MSCVSAHDGLVSFDDVPSGHYYVLSEAFAPEGYEVSADCEIKISAGEVIFLNSGNEWNEVRKTMTDYTYRVHPDVVVLDYGKPIVASPLEKNNSNYTLLGISALSPENGGTASESVKLKNGNAVIENGKSVSTVVLRGILVTEPFTVDSTVFVYPSNGTFSSAENTSPDRYSVCRTGGVVRYTAGLTNGTVICESLSNNEFAEDGGLVFYRSGNYFSVASGYTAREKTVYTEKTVTFYRFTGVTESGNRVVPSTNSDEAYRTTIIGLSEGPIFTAYRGSDGTMYIYND